MLTWLKSLAFMAAIIFMVTGTYLCFYTGFLTVFLFFFFFLTRSLVTVKQVLNPNVNFCSLLTQDTLEPHMVWL